MTDLGKDAAWIDELMTAEPGGETWNETLARIGREFPRMETEDQGRAVETLAALAGKSGVAELMDKLWQSDKTSIHPMIVLAKARKKMGAEDEGPLAAELEKWLVVCEGLEGSCSPDDFFTLPENAQKAVLNHLALWLRADVIQKLKDSSNDKKKTKLIAKALHRAKSLGASVAEEGGSTYVMEERDEYVEEAYVAPPDVDGTYFIYLYKTVFGKNTLYVILLSDRDGVFRFDAYRVPRPRFDRMLESSRKNPHAIIVKADPGFARRLIRDAESAGQKRGKGQHEEYLASRRSLGINKVGDAPHTIWSVLAEDEMKEALGLVAKSAELAGHRMFEDWRLVPLEEGKLVTELVTLDNSPIELSEAQKREREEDLFKIEAERLIGVYGRELWRDRLLNCAYVLHLLGGEEEARTAAAAALDIMETETPPPPLVVELLRRSVREGMSEEGGGGKLPDMDRGGLIVT